MIVLGAARAEINRIGAKTGCPMRGITAPRELRCSLQSPSAADPEGRVQKRKNGVRIARWRLGIKS